MITKNLKSAIKAWGNYQTGQSDSFKTGFRYADGTYAQLSAYTGAPKFVTNCELFVGSGNTLATVDDYNLENRITTLTTVSNVQKTTSQTGTPEERYNDNNITYVITVFQNNTEEPITVSEVGMFVTGGTFASNPIMYSRIVLDEPIIIQPTKAYSFMIVIG